MPERRKDSPGSPWQFVALLPLFDPPRHDSAETIKKALDLGVNVKMITGKLCQCKILYRGRGEMFEGLRLLLNDFSR